MKGVEPDTAEYASSSSLPPSRPPSSLGPSSDGGMDTTGEEEDDDIEALIREAEMEQAAQYHSGTNAAPKAVMDEDEEMWNDFDASFPAPAPVLTAQATNHAPNQSIDEDEEMWDILHEMENQPRPSGPSHPSVPPAPAETQPAPPIPRLIEDFDEIYE